MGMSEELGLAPENSRERSDSEFQKGTAFNLLPYRNKVTFKRYQASGIASRGRFFNRKRGPRVGERSLTRLLLAPVYGAKEVRGLSPCHRPQTVKHHDSLSSFPYGNGQSNSCSANSKRVGHQRRFVGRLSTYTNTSSIQKVSETTPTGTIVPVQGNVFWAKHSSKNIHKAPRSSSCPPSFKWDNCTSLSGRLVDQRAISNNSLKSYPSSAISIPQTWPASQLQEVRACSQDSVCIPGYGHRSETGLDKTYTSTGGKDIGACSAPGYLQSGTSTSTSFSLGQSESCLSVHSTGQATCSSTSILCQNLGTQSQGGNRFLYSSRAFIPISSGLVEEPRASTPGSAPPSSRSSGHIDHRCQPSRLGSLFGEPQDIGQVVQGGISPPYFNTRVESSSSSFGNSQRSSVRQEPSPLVRQYCGSSIPPERGRNSFPLSVSGDQGHSNVVSSTQCYITPILSTGPSKLSGRPAVPFLPSPGNRVDNSCGHFSPDPLSVPRIGCGLVCNKPKQPTPSVHQPMPRPSSLEGRCIYSGVGTDDAVCISTIQTDSRSIEEAAVITHPDDPDCPSMAQSELVPRSSGPAIRPTTSAPNLAQVAPTTSGPGVSSEPSAPPTSRLATVRSRIRQAGFSGSVAKYAAASQRPSSLRLYQSHWRVFSAWCDERDVNPSEASVHHIADFLVYLYEVKKYAPSTIANYRSSIASALGDFEGVPLSLHPCLSKLIKAFSSTRPIERPRVPEWNLSRVLRTLRSEDFEPPKWQSRQDRLRCTWKTIFLLALASASRRSELQALSRAPRDLIFSDRGMSMRVIPGFLAKTAVPGMDPAPFFIPALEPFSGRDSRDRLLCPVRMVKKYLAFTGGTVPKERLFRKVRGEGPPSSQTIASWIKACVRHAHQHYPVHVTAHQVRRMSASWAFHGGVHSVEDILQAGTWASHSTFTSFYLADVRLQPDGQHRMHPVVARKQLARF